MKNIKELMQWRFACQHFDTTKKITDSDLKEILEIARLAPSSYGLQAWKFIVITNEDLKTKLAPACYNQPQITEASALIICCARTDLLGENGVVQRYLHLYAKENNKKVEETQGYQEMLERSIKRRDEHGQKNWVQKQVYIPAEAIILGAAEKGIDSCPMEGFDEEAVAKILDLPEYLHPTILISLGYRKMEATKKVRFALEDVVESRA